MTTPTVPPAPPLRVPEDFEKTKEQRETAGLTAEEVAEFRQLRAEKKAADAKAASDAAEAAAKLSPPTHHVHLASGDVVDGSTIETHYATAHGDVIPVTGAWLKPEFVAL